MAKGRTERPPRKDVLLLNPQDIVVEKGFNVRTDYGDIDELMRSIEENGVKNPARGFTKDGEYILTDGHRRLEACLTLAKRGIEVKIPFITDKAERSMEQRVINQIICNDGKKLTPLEEAEAIHRLINYGMIEQDIIKKTGKTGVYISNLKLLQAAPQKVKNMIASDIVSSTLAMKVLRETKDFQKAVEILEDAIEFSSSKSGGNGKANVTQKDVDKSQGKQNSFSTMRKMFKKSKDRIVRDDKVELYEFANRLIAGEYNQEDLDKMFYEPVVEEADVEVVGAN